MVAILTLIRVKWPLRHHSKLESSHVNFVTEFDHLKQSRVLQKFVVVVKMTNILALNIVT